MVAWAILAILGFWFLYFSNHGSPQLLQTQRFDLTLGVPEDPLRSLKLLAMASRTLFPWLILFPLIAGLGWRFRFERRTWLTSVLIHLVGGILLSMVATNIAEYRIPNNKHVHTLKRLRAAAEDRPGDSTSNNRRLEREAFLIRFLSDHWNVLIYWLMVAGTQSVYYSRRALERELSAHELSLRLSEARLEVLRGQLQPHFVFNALHSVSALIPMDPQAAQEALNSVAELLRASLNLADRQQVSMREELQFLKLYLEIQKLRFGELLQLKINIPDEVLDQTIPPLLLQPLVENSIKHGLGGSASCIMVCVKAFREGRKLVISVQDNGPGTSMPVSHGVGLMNLKRRLETLYPHQHQLEIATAPGAGFSVTIQFPIEGPSA